MFRRWAFAANFLIRWAHTYVHKRSDLCHHTSAPKIASEHVTTLFTIVLVGELHERLGFHRQIFACLDSFMFHLEPENASVRPSMKTHGEIEWRFTDELLSFGMPPLADVAHKFN